jgi:hypothetical protein
MTPNREGSDHVCSARLMVEFASHGMAMENSNRAETGDFAAFLSRLSDSPLTFRNLDVLREEDL